MLCNNVEQVIEGDMQVELSVQLCQTQSMRQSQYTHTADYYYNRHTTRVNEVQSCLSDGLKLMTRWL